MKPENNICIVGSGIIGAYCALNIKRLIPEAKIKIIDREPFSYEGASCGNLGGFATCEVQPRTTFSNLLKVPYWLANPLSPITVRPSYFFSLLPWIWTFIKSTFTPGHFDHVVKNQQKLMEQSYQAHKEALTPIGLDSLIKEEGTICLYKKPESLKA